jgi:hypothetical protein
MADYRLYLMSDDDHIFHAADLTADDDREAIELVRLRQEGSDVELWCGRRKVAMIPRGQPPILAPPDSPSPASSRQREGA